MFRLASATALVCVALAVDATNAQAFQCLNPEDFIDDLKAARSNTIDPVMGAAGFIISDLDLVFVGKLDKTTELAASGQLLTLYEFKQVRWLKGRNSVR